MYSEVGLNSIKYILLLRVTDAKLKLGFLSVFSWRDVPGGPVAKTLCSQCRASRFDHWSGN